MRPSPLQNRAAPDGSLHAVAARGTLMGNRGGRLHREDGTLGAARWRSRAWICCRLAFRDRHRAVMGAGYTEIFFLDEATALAAGHRPCFECRRADARAFAALGPGGAVPRAPAMDRTLHAERLAPPQTLAFGALPQGDDLRGRWRLLPARRQAAPAGASVATAPRASLRRAREGRGAHAADDPRDPRRRLRTAPSPERRRVLAQRAVRRGVPFAGEAVAVRVDAIAIGVGSAAGQEGALRRVGIPVPPAVADAPDARTHRPR